MERLKVHLDFHSLFTIDLIGRDGAWGFGFVVETQSTIFYSLLFQWHINSWMTNHVSNLT